MNLIEKLDQQNMKETLPQMNVGDTVRVHVKIKEWAWRRSSRFIPPTSWMYRQSAAVRSAGLSSTICAIAWARPQRSRKSFNSEKKEPSGSFFLF